MKTHTVCLKQVDMLCPKCLLNVVKGLGLIQGVTELDVNLEQKRVKVTFENENLSRKKIQKIVHESIIYGKLK